MLRTYLVCRETQERERERERETSKRHLITILDLIGTRATTLPLSSPQPVTLPTELLISQVILGKINLQSFETIVSFLRTLIYLGNCVKFPRAFSATYP
jgi:hypothetical protein